MVDYVTSTHDMDLSIAVYIMISTGEEEIKQTKLKPNDFDF